MKDCLQPRPPDQEGKLRGRTPEICRVDSEGLLSARRHRSIPH